MKNTHQQSIQDCLPKIIGLPYSAFDCYELIQLLYKKAFSIELDTLYQVTPDELGVNKMMEQKKGDFIKVTKPEAGDIILINIIGLTCHVGVYIGGGKFLHTRKSTGSVIDRISRWEKRIEGYYRCAELE